jgi:O-antigen ligase
MQGAPANLHPVSVYSFATEMELSRLTIYLMIFLMAAFGPRTHEQVHSMLRMLAIFGFFLALFAVTQKATWNGKLYWVRELSYNRGNPLGPFVNKNHFAGWMCMVAPLSFGIGLMSRSMSRRIRYIFFAVVMAITIFFSLSRGGIISFLLGTIILALTVVWGVSSKKSLIPVLSFVVALLGYLIYLGVSPIVQRFVQSGMSSHERLLVWSASMTAFRDFPVFGTGLGTFQHIFPMYKPDGITMFYQHAHNDYVEILLELGISGAFLMLVFLGLAGKHILYVRWRGRERYLKAAFVASLVSIAVFSLFDFNLHIPSNAILLSFILGLAVAMSRFERMADRKKLVLRERPT